MYLGWNDCPIGVPYRSALVECGVMTSQISIFCKGKCFLYKTQGAPKFPVFNFLDSAAMPRSPLPSTSVQPSPMLFQIPLLPSLQHPRSPVTTLTTISTELNSSKLPATHPIPPTSQSNNTEGHKKEEEESEKRLKTSP